MSQETPLPDRVEAADELYRRMQEWAEEAHEKSLTVRGTDAATILLLEANYLLLREIVARDE